MAGDKDQTIPRWRRFFVNQGEFFHENGKTYVLSNQWGNETMETLRRIDESFPNAKIEIKPSA
jgi:hypothetical protein